MAAVAVNLSARLEGTRPIFLGLLREAALSRLGVGVRLSAIVFAVSRRRRGL